MLKIETGKIPKNTTATTERNIYYSEKEQLERTQKRQESYKNILPFLSAQDYFIDMLRKRYPKNNYELITNFMIDGSSGIFETSGLGWYDISLAFTGEAFVKFQKRKVANNWEQCFRLMLDDADIDEFYGI